MNKQRRTVINAAISTLEELIDSITTASSDEREYYDNMPEGLQASERGEKADAAATALEEAVERLEEAKAQLEEAVEE